MNIDPLAYNLSQQETVLENYSERLIRGIFEKAYRYGVYHELKIQDLIKQRIALVKTNKGKSYIENMQDYILHMIVMTRQYSLEDSYVRLYINTLTEACEFEKDPAGREEWQGLLKIIYKQFIPDRHKLKQPRATALQVYWASLYLQEEGAEGISSLRTSFERLKALKKLKMSKKLDETQLRKLSCSTRKRELINSILAQVYGYSPEEIANKISVGRKEWRRLNSLHDYLQKFLNK